MRRERGTRGGKRVVGVYSARGAEIGYISPGDADRLAGLVFAARAIFQGADTFGAIARVTFDGSTPSLPQPKPKPQRITPPRPTADEYCDIFPIRAAG